MMACLGSLLSPTPMLARTLVHYGLHFVFPLVIALLWPRRRWTVMYLLLLSTMLIDVDHLLARPIFDPNRCSVGTHLLHSYPMVGLYVVMLFLPYERWGWPWWLRVLAVGLTLHILTDWQDFYLWLH